MKINEDGLKFNRLASDIKDDKFLIAYFAVGMVFLENHVIEEPKYEIKKFVYAVNEIAVVDKVLLESIIYKLYEYFRFLKQPKTVTAIPTSFLDVIYVNRYISANIIEAVEKNLETYKECYIVSQSVVGNYLEKGN